MNTQALIQEFLALNRFAMVGVSRESKDFSRYLFKEFLTHGYDVAPVNPLTLEINHQLCYPRVGSIDPPVSAALLMTPKRNSEMMVHECFEAGINLLWFYGISGMKDVNADAVRVAEQLGIRVIPGYCPFMFMRTSSWAHKLHGAAWKMLGKYPR